VAKAEWGSKQICPKCGTRFYDLGKEPAVCVACSHEFVPEPILKSKQPLPEPERKPAKAAEGDDLDDTDSDLDDDEDEDSIADVSLDDDDADLDDVVDDSLDDEE